ncbi:hypothetical protein Bca52824_016379 [Brassica carinata]|uniref:DUF287 domain-containing protein n=1 Tax=Brassica carinata TaxID=52824 RepID=A0A8X7W3W5_BRACI|nr:hypothetical protein Bca52824_016379 [Brassica carinata]
MEPRKNDEEADERAIQLVRQHETESHADSDIESILVATAAEKELLASIGMDKESCWAEDADDAAVDCRTKIIWKGKKQVFFEEQFGIDFESRTSRIEGPTNPIGGPSNNAESGQAHTDSVEAIGATPGAEGFKAMEGRLMNAVRDAMKEVNEKVTSLSQKLALLEEEVKSLRLSGPGMSCDDPSDQDGVSDNPADQDAVKDGSDNNESKEEDGSDNKESEEQDGGLIHNITEKIQRVHGDGDVVMDDDDAEIYAHASEVERNLEEKAKEDDGKEAVPAKKSKGCERMRSPVYTRRLKAVEEEAAEEEAAKKPAAEKEASKKAAAKKAAPKKEAAKKTAAKKAAAEKEASEKAAAEKAAAKKTAATKAAQEDAAQKKQKKPKRKKVGKL